MRIRTAAALVSLGMTATLCGPASAESSVDSAHPFSDPVWWPLRTPSVVDCTKLNDCTKPHHFYGIGALSKDRDNTREYNTTAGVFAMGGGIAHIGDGVGRDCGRKYDSTTFGKWVWIDHGGGVISKYGHLSRIDIREGQRVGPDTRIGTVGNTGVASPSNCHIHYVTFQVKYQGIFGPKEGREFSTSSVGAPDGKLLACGPGGRAQVWPDHLALRGESTRMELVRKGEILRASGSDCRSGAPATVGKARGVKLATAGAGALKTRWTKAPAEVDKVRVELGEYHPSTKLWDSEKREKWVDLSASKTSYTHKKLNRKKLWRVRVWFHNTAGWSAPSGWVERKTR